LIERFRAGDEAAFGPLFAKYKPRLAVLIRYKLGETLRERVEVDDILQEVFLAAVKSMGSFGYRSPGSFLSWLSTIAAHVIADEARTQARQKRRAVPRALRKMAVIGGAVDAGKSNIFSSSTRASICRCKAFSSDSVPRTCAWWRNPSAL
jgi:DNA-directed RNA polymerase specialized sigma24 family protein